MTDYIKEWDVVHVASPMDPWSHQSKETNSTMANTYTQAKENRGALHRLKIDNWSARATLTDPKGVGWSKGPTKPPRTKLVRYQPPPRNPLAIGWHVDGMEGRSTPKKIV
jgi:hypothetical protein